MCLLRANLTVHHVPGTDMQQKSDYVRVQPNILIIQEGKLQAAQNNEPDD